MKKPCVMQKWLLWSGYSSVKYRSSMKRIDLMHRRVHSLLLILQEVGIILPYPCVSTSMVLGYDDSLRPDLSVSFTLHRTTAERGYSVSELQTTWDHWRKRLCNVPDQIHISYLLCNVPDQIHISYLLSSSLIRYTSAISYLVAWSDTHQLSLI